MTNDIYLDKGKMKIITRIAIIGCIIAVNIFLGAWLYYRSLKFSFDWGGFTGSIIGSCATLYAGYLAWASVDRQLKTTEVQRVQQSVIQQHTERMRIAFKLFDVLSKLSVAVNNWISTFEESSIEGQTTFLQFLTIYETRSSEIINTLYSAPFYLHEPISINVMTDLQNDMKFISQATSKYYKDESVRLSALFTNASLIHRFYNVRDNAKVVCKDAFNEAERCRSVILAIRPTVSA